MHANGALQRQNVTGRGGSICKRHVLRQLAPRALRHDSLKAVSSNNAHYDTRLRHMT